MNQYNPEPDKKKENSPSTQTPRAKLEEPEHDATLAASLVNKFRTTLPSHMQEVEAPLSSWITSLLDAERKSMRALESFGFRRLEFYFPQSIINDTLVGVVPKCPELPLKALGLEALDMPSGANARGITFRNTYFVAKGSESSQRLHFHEAVHVVQWKILGESGFLLTYGAGLLAGGYAGNPLEVMGYELDARYAAGGEPFDAVREVRSRLMALAGI